MKMRKLIFLLMGFFLWQSALSQFQASAPPIKRFQVDLVRPANATAYTAGDVVKAVADSLPIEITYPVAISRFFSGYIVAAKLEHDTANTTNGTFRLFFYGDSVNLGKTVDNAAFTPVFGDDFDSLRIGHVNFTLQSAGTASSQVVDHYLQVDPPLPFVLDGTSAVKRSIWGILTATGAYTPKRSGTFRITIWIQPR